MRLDKYLADMGLGTRSELKKEIRAGAALVNRQVVRDPGAAVTEYDEVLFRTLPVVYETHVYYMLHKPAGVITATRDRHEKTVLDLLPEQARKDLFPVGRLDRDTEGLLLITNDGALAHRLLSPKHHANKSYLAVVSGGPVAENEINAFRQGICLEDGSVCLPARLQTLSEEFSIFLPGDAPLRSGSPGSSHPSPGTSGSAALAAAESGETGTSTVIQISIQEGKFHQIKRMFRAIGRDVLYLKRISMGPLTLDPELPAGACRRLTPDEVRLCQAD